MATKTNLIGASEAAKQLGVSRSTVNRWAQTGKLKPALKGDGRTGTNFFRVLDVERLLAAH